MDNKPTDKLPNKPTDDLPDKRRSVEGFAAHLKEQGLALATRWQALRLL